MASPLVVRVVGPDGLPMVGAPVQWEFLAGKGRPAGDSAAARPRFVAYTDAAGESAVSWELGRAAGVQAASADLVVSAAASTEGPLAAPGGNGGGGGGGGKRVGFSARARTSTPASVVVSPDEIVMPEGQSAQMTVEVRDLYGNPISGLTVQWGTSDPSIAAVSGAGVLSAVATGSTWVTATMDTLSATASVVAVGAQYAEIARVVALPDSLHLTQPGEATVVNALAENSVGATISGVTFEFSSTDTSVVEVDSMGNVTAKAVGTAMIAVSALCCGLTDGVAVQVGGETDTLTITVITSNSIVVSTLSLQVGDSAWLDATAANVLGVPIGDIDPTWNSTNPSVASVSGTGVVQALSAGNTNITASYAGVTATVPTTVSSVGGPPPPPPPPPPQGSWPNNEPTGMARIVSTNGSDKYFGGSPTSPGWFYGGRWNDNTYVQDGIPDAGSRYGTVIEKRLNVGDVAGWNGLAEYNWSSTAGVRRHLYFRAIFKFSSNYQICSTNEKPHGYLGGPGGDGADVYAYMRPSGAWSLANEFPGAGFNDINLNFTMTRGQWITLEMYFVAESSSGASDGERHIWMSGSLKDSATGVNWGSGTPGWSQMDIFNYWGGGGCTKTVNDVISISEIYLSGK
ncbi:MAG: Ig-like domain-containing protein [Gemmatimonadota bacterium]